MPSDYGLVPSKPLRQGYKVIEKPAPGMGSFALNIDYGGRWIDLNDSLNYKVGAGTLTQSPVTWRKVVVTSPVAEGSYTVHAVKEMVSEQVEIFVHGANQWEMQLNVKQLEELFGRLDYRLRLDFDDYREYWKCQTAEYITERSQVFAHNGMAKLTFTVPRFPTVTIERIV